MDSLREACDVIDDLAIGGPDVPPDVLRSVLVVAAYMATLPGGRMEKFAEGLSRFTINAYRAGYNAGARSVTDQSKEVQDG